MFQFPPKKGRKFGPPIAEFQVKVSGYSGSLYEHHFQVDKFIGRMQEVGTLESVHGCFNSRNFSEAGRELKNGEVYNVKVFPVITKVTFARCLRFLKNKGAVLAGAQGLTLALEQAPQRLPIYTWIVSPDEPKTLPKKKFIFWQRHLAPRAKLIPKGDKNGGGQIGFSLKCISIERGISAHRCILAFFK